MKVAQINNISFKNQQYSQNPQYYLTEKEDSSNDALKLSLSLAGLGVAGVAAVILGKGKASVMSFEDALKKNGVELKNNIATIKTTGEKFTGKISRNINANKKETVRYNNGQITEKVYHNALGKELEGFFYKDGELKTYVGEHSGIFYKSFFIKHYKDGNVVSRSDIMGERITSVFDWVRREL